MDVKISAYKKLYRSRTDFNNLCNILKVLFSSSSVFFLLNNNKKKFVLRL